MRCACMPSIARGQSAAKCKLPDSRKLIMASFNHVRWMRATVVW